MRCTLAALLLAMPAVAAEPGWHPFAPPPDPFKPSPIDLRHLNEKEAGASGRVKAKGSQFVLGSGEPVRFWAVNGPTAKKPDELAKEARLLAKYGVNMVRVHHGYWDDRLEIDPAKVQGLLDVVTAMKAEGIYTHVSFYFPLWIKPTAKTPWLKGYDGTRHPFAALFFNEDFQTAYRGWLKAILTTPHTKTGKTLLDDPAVFGLEIVNEDSYFFWTFDAKNLPDEQLTLLEAKFGTWLAAKYGSVEKALTAWKGDKLKRDDAAAGRVAFRPLWNMANQRTARDQDTARFLAESQKAFYSGTVDHLRGLGFKGLVTTSNWTTADARVLGPLEKWTYTAGDFVDRHGYFECQLKGENAAWSIRDGHTYRDRSALRFDPEEAGKPKLFAHPVIDPSYNGLPSMVSETTFTRPNRYRSEAPVYYAAYGALQDSDAIVHFAWDGPKWQVKPNFWMQPWTLATPAMLGQFPAAALIYRRGLIATGETVVDLNLKLDDLFALKGTPLPQDAALDELRLKDVTGITARTADGLIDPLVHYTGRTNVTFSKGGGPAKVADTTNLIDRKTQTVRSTTGELNLDYGKGVLTLNAAGVQGVSGNLKAAGAVTLADVKVKSDLDLGHVLVVALDGRPIATAKRLLVQVMTEEKATGFATRPGKDGLQAITSVGKDPWLFREVSGTVTFAGKVKVTPLDLSGYPAGEPTATAELRLTPATVYYLAERE